MSQKILIVGPSWVGDMVMAQSLFRLLKANDPICRIDVLAPAWTFSVLSCMPEVTRAIEFPINHGELKLGLRYRIGKKLRAEHYQQAIVLPNTFKSALVPLFARIPKRTGWLREGRSLLLNDGRTLDKTRYPLMIEQYMALGLIAESTIPKPYPYPAFTVLREDQLKALEKIHPVFDGKPILGIAPGAEFGPSKRWPEEYYAQVANQKLSEGWNVWIFGSIKDKPITDKVMALTNDACENMSGRTSLADSIALISLTSGMLTNDSGLMHVASALHKPVIAVYGSTSPAFTPPLSEQAQILQLNMECQPCFERTCPLTHHRCMQELKPEMVLAAMQAWG